MADATQTGIDAAALAVAARIIGTTGVDGTTLLYAAAGASLGMLLTPRMGRIRALSVFVSFTLVASALGNLIAYHWFKDDLHYRWAISSLLAVLAYPILKAAAQRVPGAFDLIFKQKHEPDGAKQ